MGTDVGAGGRDASIFDTPKGQCLPQFKYECSQSMHHNPVVAKVQGSSGGCGGGSFVDYKACLIDTLDIDADSAHLVAQQVYGDPLSESDQAGAATIAAYLPYAKAQFFFASFFAAPLDDAAFVTLGLTESRLIPGTAGIVTGGSSRILGENILVQEFGLAANTSRLGTEAQHLIPVQMRTHPVIRKLGMELDDASNGMLLPQPGLKDSNALSTHMGGHPLYNRLVRERLNLINVSRPVSELDLEVFRLQRALKTMHKMGTPIYKNPTRPGGGSSMDLLRKTLDKILKNQGF